jgi:hypothetical protein
MKTMPMGRTTAAEARACCPLFVWRAWDKIRNRSTYNDAKRSNYLFLQSAALVNGFLLRHLFFADIISSALKPFQYLQALSGDQVHGGFYGTGDPG